MNATAIKVLLKGDPDYTPVNLTWLQETVAARLANETSSGALSDLITGQASSGDVRTPNHRLALHVRTANDARALIQHNDIDTDLALETRRRKLLFKALQEVTDITLSESEPLPLTISEFYKLAGQRFQIVAQNDPILGQANASDPKHMHLLLSSLFSFSVSYGFTSDFNKGYEILAPFVGFDPKVLALLKDLASQDGSARSDIYGYFKDVRDLFALGGHDFIHQMQGIFVSSLVLDHRLTRSFATQFSPRYHFECAAVVLQQAIWDHLTDTQPQIGNELLKRGCLMIDRITRIRTALHTTYGQNHRHEDLVCYLGAVGLSQLDILLDLKKPHVEKVLGQKWAKGNFKSFVKSDPLSHSLAQVVGGIQDYMDAQEYPAPPQFYAIQDPNRCSYHSIIRAVRSEMNLASARGTSPALSVKQALEEFRGMQKFLLSDAPVTSKSVNFL